MSINQHRYQPNLAVGDMVFRKLPPVARPPKKLLHPAAEGPYYVHKQNSESSVVLVDTRGELVDGGKKIPLTQIVVGPKSALVVSGEMISLPSPYGGKMGKKASQRSGLDLAVHKLLCALSDACVSCVARLVRSHTPPTFVARSSCAESSEF